MPSPMLGIQEPDPPTHNVYNLSMVGGEGRTARVSRSKCPEPRSREESRGEREREVGRRGRKWREKRRDMGDGKSSPIQGTFLFQSQVVKGVIVTMSSTLLIFAG